MYIFLLLFLFFGFTQMKIYLKPSGSEISKLKETCVTGNGRPSDKYQIIKLVFTVSFIYN